MGRTPDAVLGPFYRGAFNGYGPPHHRNWIIPSGRAGNLQLSIYIRDATTKARIHFAQVEVWQADANGIYDLSNPRPADSPLEFWDNTASYRGLFSPYGAGHEGTLYTDVPARYYSPPTETLPGFYREPHIHFRITKPGHDPLITQVFFPRSPLLPPSEDVWYVPQNTVTLGPQIHGIWLASFLFEL